MTKRPKPSWCASRQTSAPRSQRQLAFLAHPPASVSPPYPQPPHFLSATRIQPNRSGVPQAPYDPDLISPRPQVAIASTPHHFATKDVVLTAAAAFDPACLLVGSAWVTYTWHLEPLTHAAASTAPPPNTPIQAIGSELYVPVAMAGPWSIPPGRYEVGLRMLSTDIPTVCLLPLQLSAVAAARGRF